MGKRSPKKEILGLSKNVVSTVGMMTLSVLDFWITFGTTPHARNASSLWQAYYKNKASGDSFTDLILENEETFRKAFYHLRRRGLIEFVKDELYYKPRITKQGRERLRETLPEYKRSRVWDKKLYLITYDISEERKKDRDMLREYLKNLGCGMLQYSVWITPYNPKEILKSYIKKMGLRGSVLISDLASKGSIGEETVPEIVERVYGLRDVNNSYEEFIKKYFKKNRASRLEAYFEFKSILRGDPQLPFELLPDYWVGDEAYKLYREITRISRV